MKHRFHKGRSAPLNTSPVTRRMVRNSHRKILFFIFGLPLGIIAVLYFFGSPALLIQYTYTGSQDAKLYHHCTYLSLNGWHEVLPGYSFNQCPTLKFVPFKFSF